MKLLGNETDTKTRTRISIVLYLFTSYNTLYVYKCYQYWFNLIIIITFIYKEFYYTALHNKLSFLKTYDSTLSTYQTTWKHSTEHTVILLLQITNEHKLICVDVCFVECF